MNLPTQETLKEYAPAVLRYTMSAVFLWFGTNQVLNPLPWTGFLPEFVKSVLPFSPTVFVMLNGIFEIIFASLLCLGLFTRLAALLLGGHLIGIAASFGWSELAARDFGLALATLTIFAFGPDRLCLDSKPSGKARYAGAIKLAILIVFIVGGTLLNIQ